MTVHVGPFEFDYVSYDREGDVLYLRRGPQGPAADTVGTPEGHAVRLDECGEIIGITVVSNSPTGVDIRTFTSKYDRLWEAKLALTRG